MIPVSSATLDSQNTIECISKEENWQNQMGHSLKSATELLNFLQIRENDLPYRVDHNQPFRVTVTTHFASLIDPQDPFDPILLQILPRTDEQIVWPEDSHDPLQEAEYSPTPGLIHKYPNRVLLIAHQACAIHCRYCFRRHYPYQQQRLTRENLDRAIQYIMQRPEIDEVILSGGDPLSLSDDRLLALITQLEALPQLQTIRFHSRTPVVLPARITRQMVEKIANSPKKIVMVLHVNHARELSPQLADKIAQLKAAGALVLNQTVLLKNVNDDATCQAELCRQLFAHGVLPYYLHRLDKVAGAGHFNISLEEAQSIWRELQTMVSGYLLPRLVEEIPGKRSKTWENPSAY